MENFSETSTKYIATVSTVIRYVTIKGQTTTSKAGTYLIVYTH